MPRRPQNNRLAMLKELLDGPPPGGYLSLDMLRPLISGPPYSRRTLESLGQQMELADVDLIEEGGPRETLGAFVLTTREGRQGRTGDPISAYVSDVSVIPPLDVDEEHFLGRLAELVRYRLERQVRPLLEVYPEAAKLTATLGLTDPYLEMLVEKIQKQSRRRKAAPGNPRGSRATQAAIQRLRRRYREYLWMRRALVEPHLPLVVNFARRYTRFGVPLLDLVQDGNEGLMKAHEKYDWRKGCRFRTYAMWWVHQAILRGLCRGSRTVRIPHYINQRLRKVLRLQQQSLQTGEGERSFEDVAHSIDEPQESIERLRDAQRAIFSLDQPVGDSEDMVLADTLPETNEDPDPDPFFEAALRGRLEELLRQLPWREQEILRLRYGLADGETHSLEEISRIFNVSRERIRQLQVKALRTLQAPSHRHRLEGYL